MTKNGNDFSFIVDVVDAVSKIWGSVGGCVMTALVEAACLS